MPSRDSVLRNHEERRTQETAVFHDSNAAVPLCDEDPAIRRKREVCRLGQATHDRRRGQLYTIHGSGGRNVKAPRSAQVAADPGRRGRGCAVRDG